MPSIPPAGLIGLTEQVAKRQIEAAGYKVRVTRRDRQRYIGTCDYRTDRINLEIENGKVVKACVG